MSRKSLSLLSLLIVLTLVLVACGAPKSEGVGKAPDKGAAVTIRVWGEANEVEHWRVDGPAKAAADVEEWTVTVDPLRDDAGWADYKKKFTLAADAGEAPDIVLSGHEDAPVWANAGYIVDFEFCRNEYPEFDDVIESLWNSVTWNGKLWGVPQDTEARPMFYNKAKLLELGWSQAEVDALPEKIKTGDFTLDDLIATAKEAIAAGVVEPGYGYWHRPSKGGDWLQYYFSYGGQLYDADEDKLVVDRSALKDWYAFQRRVVTEGITPENFIGTDWAIWHDAVSHGNVLFWNGGIWQWADWAKNYVADLGGQDYLFSFAGYALQPSGIKGQPGGTLSHPLIYMIVNEQSSGAGNQEVSCALLAKTTTAEINTLHAVDSTHLGLVKSQATYPAYANDRLLSETLYMLDYNYYQPNHTMYGPYFDILWEGVVKAENGDASPEQAAEDAITLLQSELGDVLIVRD